MAKKTNAELQEELDDANTTLLKREKYIMQLQGQVKNLKEGKSDSGSKTVNHS